MIYPHNFEKKIEFDAIRTMLKEKCLSTMGRERVDEMQFMTDFDSIEARLNETEEFMRLMRVEQNFPNDFYYDVREPLHRIRIQGMYLNEEELFALRRSLDTIGRIAALLHKRNGEGNNNNNEEENFLYPCLQRCASDVQAFPRIIRSIDAIVD